MDLPHAIVTWVGGDGGEHRCEGELCLVDRESVIVLVREKVTCFIPRSNERLQIETHETAPSVGSSASSIAATPGTTSAASAINDGPADVRDVNGVIVEGDY